MMRFFILIICLVPEFTLAQPRWAKVKLADFFTAQQIVFVDSEVGYVAGAQTKYPHYEILYRTSDAGNTWTEIDPYGAGGDTSRLHVLNPFNFSAPNRRDLFIGTQAAICSFDSGNTWIGRDYGKFGAPSNWQMFSATEGYAEDGSLNRIVKTIDSAQSWDHVLNYNATNSIWTDSLHGMYTLRDTLNDTGTYDIIKGLYTGSTTDGGKNWELHFTALPNPPKWQGVATEVRTRSIYLYPYYLTTDMGATWQIDSSIVYPVNTMALIGNTRWMSRANGDTLNANHPAEWIAMSSDGEHWDIDSTIARGLNISSIAFTDATHGWAVGNDTSTAGAPFSDSTIAYVLKYIGPPLAVVEHRQEPAALALSMYPNPAEDFLHVEIATADPILRAEAVGVLGNSVDCPFQVVGGQAADVNVSSLVSGVYELRLWTTTGSSFKQFVKLP